MVINKPKIASVAIVCYLPIPMPLIKEIDHVICLVFDICNN